MQINVLRKIKENLQTRVGICISTYLNAECYSATWRMELNDVRLMLMEVKIS